MLFEGCIAIVDGVIVDPRTGRPLPEERAELLRESLREELRRNYGQFLAAGMDDSSARAALGPEIALLTELDRISGSIGDSLAGTSEADFT